MALRVPERHYDALVALLQLPESSWESLLASLRDWPPSLSVRGLAELVAPKLNLPEDIARDGIRMLGSLYSARVRGNAAIEAFVEDVCRAAQASDRTEFRAPAESWTRFKRALASVLSLEQTLGVRSKAFDLQLEHPRTLCTARILTDVRPVFGTDPTQPPPAVFVSHTLRIAYHEGDSLKEFFVALDSADLRELKGLIERASLKEANLRRFFGTYTIPCVDLE